MKYTIRPKGNFGLVEKGIAQIFRDDEEGKTENVGVYKNTLLPGGGISHRVFFDTTRSRWDINLTDAELCDIALRMRLINMDTKELIKTCDPFNEFDPFFRHDDLYLEVPNGGVTLDDETAKGKYWFAAIQSEPTIFDVNHTTDNPLIKKNQPFSVVTAGHSEKEIARDVKEGEKATGIYHAIKDDMQKMIDTCRAMDVVIGETPDIEMIRSVIYTKITIEKDYLTRDRVRNIDKFLSLHEMKKEDFSFRAEVGRAIAEKVFTKERNQYVFDNVVMGNTPEKVYQFLSRKDKSALKEKLIAHMETIVAQ